MLRTIQGQVHAAYTLQPLTPAMGVSCRGVDAYLRFTSTQSRRALQGSSLSRNRARAQERRGRQGSSRRHSQAPGTNSLASLNPAQCEVPPWLLLSWDASADQGSRWIRRARTSGAREAYKAIHHRRGSVVRYAAASTHIWHGVGGIRA